MPRKNSVLSLRKRRFFSHPLEEGNFQVSTNELAEIFGITPRRVQELTKNEFMPQISRDCYDLKEATRFYVAFIRDASGQSGVASYSEERAGLTKARREHVELQNKKLSGNLVDSDEVEQSVMKLMFYLKDALFRLPSKLCGMLARMNKEGEIKAKILAEITKCLNELSIKIKEGKASDHKLDDGRSDT